LAGAQNVSFVVSSVIKDQKFEEPILPRFLDAVTRAQRKWVETQEDQHRFNG
jgi:hypothetical protein